MRADRERAVLLVVDLQEGLLSVLSDPAAVARHATLLLRAARELAIPVLVTTRDLSLLGAALPSALAEAPGVEPIDKTSFSAFGSPVLVARLRAWAGRRQLLVCGAESHVCVVRTVLGARRRGYEVFVAADAVGAIAEENRRRGLRRMERAGAALRPTVDLIAELRRTSA